MSAFDYIIVGGGTAGCILANRLTASGKYRVLVLEAGGEPKGFWIPIPAGFSKLLVDKRYNWRFKTQAEENTHLLDSNAANDIVTHRVKIMPVIGGMNGV